MAALGLGSALTYVLYGNFVHSPGCDEYTASDAPLVAHAGGGTPRATYANNIEALDLAAHHGFDLIELDFIEIDGELRLGHDEQNVSDLTLSQLLEWLAQHPDIRIVTDMKSGNQGLQNLPRDQFIPQIYELDEYDQVKRLGFRDIILTAYKMDSYDWQDRANELDLFAVTVPKEAAWLAKGIDHPVYLHTVNIPIDGYGLYTDCLVPKRSSLAS
ncbi:hypothetical protein [Sphingomicrobium clamense]|uniref:GP-PDE domain-containing protein n=1 Tax=Sphingomicrobium clamense TaxID=2851013 RepID=A0ABS6V8R6_9SPHN|nr:hypothetical protein [Sphingomicrobium sp. B8]MBW0145463.1 hypothetical protein [Sphingomicrobium sp. B8]